MSKEKGIESMTPEERFEAGSSEIQKILEKYQLSLIPTLTMQDAKPKQKVNPVLDMIDPTSEPIIIPS